MNQTEPVKKVKPLRSYVVKLTPKHPDYPGEFHTMDIDARSNAQAIKYARQQRWDAGYTKHDGTFYYSARLAEQESAPQLTTEDSMNFGIPGKPFMED